MKNLLKKNLNNQRGVTMIEYAILAAVIALVVAVAAGALGTDISDLFGRISDKIKSI